MDTLRLMRGIQSSEMARTRVRASILLLGAGLLVACDGGEGTNLENLVAIDGSSTVFPITEAVAEEFQRVMPEARVTVGISGTGGGFQKFCSGETDISNASRTIKPVEVEACAEAGIDFIELPIAYDGIAIVVNPANDWIETVTVDELRRIWEPSAQQTVMQWDQVKTGWPERELHLFGPGADSGTFDYFTDVIMGEEGASRGDFTSSEDDNVLVQGVATDELALGFFGYAYYEENRDRLKLVGVDDGEAENGQGPIFASPETVRDGTYRPLSRPVFIYVRTASLERPAVRAFIDFYLTGAADLVREVGYVPMDEEEYRLVHRRVESHLGEAASP